jgi:hypothetical protein
MALLHQSRHETSPFTRIRLAGGTVLLAALTLGGGRLWSEPTAHAQTTTPTVAVSGGREVLFRESAVTAPHDLFYGPGGAAHQPDVHGTYTFVKEDLEGSQPKLEVRDENDVRWVIKLGSEARPETVASRLVWAAGYEADEDYFVDEIHVDGLPERIHRGQQLIDVNGIVRNARLKRESDDRHKVGVWSWRQNPFTGTREFNGLRVLMAVINNWDLKDINNVIVEKKTDTENRAPEQVFEVKDVGSSFGSTRLERSTAAKGNLSDYQDSTFITHLTPGTVSFETPRRPDWIVLANAPEFFRRLRLRWIGQDIPRADAQWMGRILAQIPPNQIRDAFRAGGYAPSDVEGFASVLESRIQQLNGL